MATNDVGPAMLDRLFETLLIDDEWSVREDRSFTWWPHRLAQRVWAERVSHSRGHPVVVIHARSDLLRDVPHTAEMLDNLNMLNRFCDLNAFVFDPATAKVALHSSAVFHPDNQWMERPFSLAAAFQQSAAHVSIESVADLLGGPPDFSAHPTAGERPEPDELVGVRFGLPEADGIVPFTAEDFGAVAGLHPAPWVLANGDEYGVTIELPFFSDVPTLAATEDNPPGTAILIVRSWDAAAEAAEPDPTSEHGRMVQILHEAPARELLGSGLVLKLGLPLAQQPTDAFVLANRLNLLETGPRMRSHAMGAWHAGPSGMWFVRYFPASLFVPLDADLRQAFLISFVFDMAGRCTWALDVLGDDLDALNGRGFRS